MAQKIRKGDTCIVLKGRDRGKQGAVQKVLPQENTVLIEGINLMKRHLKPRPNVRQSGIVDMEAPLSMNNVAILCPQCNRPTRIGFSQLEDGRKVRLCKKCQANLE